MKGQELILSIWFGFGLFISLLFDHIDQVKWLQTIITFFACVLLLNYPNLVQKGEVHLVHFCANFQSILLQNLWNISNLHTLYFSVKWREKLFCTFFHMWNEWKQKSAKSTFRVTIFVNFSRKKNHTNFKKTISCAMCTLNFWSCCTFYFWISRSMNDLVEVTIQH